MRIAAAYIGVTTPQPRKFPAALVTWAVGEGVGGGGQGGLSGGIGVQVGRHQLVGHRDRDQVRHGYQGQPDGGQDWRQDHHGPSVSKDIVKAHERDDRQETHEDDEPCAGHEKPTGRAYVRDPVQARPPGLRDQRLNPAGGHRHAAKYEADDGEDGAHGGDRGESERLHEPSRSDRSHE